MPALATTLAPESVRRSRSAQQIVSSFFRDLAPHACFDSREFLAAHPDVAATKAAVLDLALEDYCRREAIGEAISPEAFARQFTRHAASVLHLLQLRQFLEENGNELSQAAPIWPEVGEDWLGFQLLEEMGRGARSRVYLAAQPEVGDRLVVLKVTPDSLTEANALGRLSHPNIVEIHSVETHDEHGLSAICMPFFGRATLNDLLLAAPSGAVPADSKVAISSVAAVNIDSAPASDQSSGIPARYVDLILEIGRQLASALAYTHENGICHFDIKPTNVLISSAGVVQLIDFNLAASASEQSFGGTVPYMSPEQLRQHLGQCSTAAEGPKSDVYSLGVLLFELLTGQHPFRSFSGHENRREAAKEILHRQQQETPFLRTSNPLINSGLETIVRACLDVDPARRPDAAQLQRQLESELSRWNKLSRWSMQHRRPLRSGIAAAALLAAASLAHFATREAPAEQAYQQAILAEEVRDFVKAETHYAAGIAADRSQARLWFGRGKCLLQQHRFAEAHHDFVQAGVHGGDPAVTAAYAAYCLCRQDRNYQESIALFEDAIQRGFDRAGLWNDLAYCYFRVGDYSKANDAIQKCLAFGQACGESHFILARLKIVAALVGKDQPDIRPVRQLLVEVRQELDEAQKLGFESADLHFDRGLLETIQATLQEGQRDAAIERINRSLTKAISLGLDPNRLHELTAIWPELADQLVRPDPAVAVTLSRPPVVDPNWSNDASRLVIAVR